MLDQSGMTPVAANHVIDSLIVSQASAPYCWAAKPKSHRRLTLHAGQARILKAFTRKSIINRTFGETNLREG
jgi:hypothetical protein